MTNIYITLLLCFGFSVVHAQKAHPCLIVNSEDVTLLTQGLSDYPMWKETVTELKHELDVTITQAIEVPVPKDPAGGYTHEQHKANGKLIGDLGMMYQITKDDKYAAYAKDILLAYAKLYPSLGTHPVDKSYARGKLFWQQLNEAVFLCDAIQGYDAIYDAISEDERQVIEKDFILPFADFISIETPYVFNKIHNHGVWATAAVGMTGMVLDNEELICRAFYGTNKQGKAVVSQVNGYGAFEGGFFTQVKQLFSPDGYYTEGPYYQRYAMTPFLLFAQGINQNFSEMDVFAYADSIFIKAVYTLIDLTDQSGEFFPINDHLKGMGMRAPSMVNAVDFLYGATGDVNLINVASQQNNRSLSKGGFLLCKAMSDSQHDAPAAVSKIIRDGSEGKQGGIGILKKEDLTTVFKFASQGLNHGHFDRLNIINYFGESEVLTDYGAARFVNVQAKEGGRYLPENMSYAKQSVAHNTVVINETSHFDAQFKVAQESHSDMIFSDFSDDINIVLAAEHNAYPNTEMKRIVAQITHEDYDNPILLDVFLVNRSAEAETIDLPYHFNGQLISTDVEMDMNVNQLSLLGADNGYQHIWNCGSVMTDKNNASLIWMQDHRFYTMTGVVDNSTEIILGRIGANDPFSNLRQEPLIIWRKKQNTSCVFASVLECHGYNNASTEKVTNQEKMTKMLSFEKKEGMLAITIESKKDHRVLLLINTNKEKSPINMTIEGVNYNCPQHYKIVKLP